MKEAYLTFCCGAFEGAFSLSVVREVFLLPALYSPPGLPRLLAGFANLSGTIYSVLDLASLLGLPTQARRIDNHLIQLHGYDQLCLVDRVAGISELASLAPLPSDHLLNNFATGVFNQQKRGVYLFSPQQLLLQAEQQRFEELRQLAELRLADLQP